MGKRLGRKVGMKRPRTPDRGNLGLQLRNSQREDDMPILSTSQSPSAEELSGSTTSEGEVDHVEPSMYNKLLLALGSGNRSFANIIKRRQREEQGTSDTEEDEEDKLQSPDVSGASDGEEESYDESCGRGISGDEVRHRSPRDLVDQYAEAAAKDEDQASDDEHVLDLETKDQADFYASENTSSFRRHLEHTLAESEIDNLTKRKFKWQVPAHDTLMSKWAGTGKFPLMEDDWNSGNGIKQRLYKHWLDVYKTSSNDFHSSKQRFFFALCNSYHDILHCNKRPFYLNGQEEDSSIMDAYIMHALNHVYKTRDLVTRNNEKLAKHAQITEEVAHITDELLDQGFTRPKVLILLPLASIALRIVKRLIELTPPSQKVNVEHMDRFLDEFGIGELKDDGHMVLDGENAKSQKNLKPVDFQALFGGNNNDHFVVGIKFTRKSLRLYSDFYSSDMIVASPLGLITKIGEAESDKEKDVDYLSSIEVLIIDHADVIAMQNWSHVNAAVEHLNRIPSKQHGTDFMRIRKWCLDGHAQFYRQTILLGSFVTPGMNALFSRLCVNYEGKVKSISEYKGVLPKVALQVRQVYERLHSTLTDADDARLDYFAKKVFPRIKDSIQGGIMIFLSSYFEFVRVRNFLKSQNASFCLLSEYTKPSDISRAKVWFFQGRRKIMLLTERAHFYFRYKIRGIQNLIIYSLPERKEFYPEIVNMLQESNNMSCTVLFSRFDLLRLERIVGTSAAKRMLASKKDTFLFC